MEEAARLVNMILLEEMVQDGCRAWINEWLQALGSWKAGPHWHMLG